MPDSSHNFDSFISILKKVRMRDSESSEIKERILAFTHGNFVLNDCMASFRRAAGAAEIAAEQHGLFAFEKSMIFNSMQSFVQEHPQHAKLSADASQGKSLRMTVLHGPNLYAHIQPFFVTQQRDSR